MLRLAVLILLLALAVPALCADSASSGSLIPEGIRVIATPDDCAIILVSDPTNGTGKGVQWLGVGGAIACNADNSIIVWSGGYAPLLPVFPPFPPPRSSPAALPMPPPAQPGSNFLWPEGIDDVRPFDLDNNIILRGDGR